MILGETYRRMREEKGMSISSLAGYEISKSQISRFELGETEISVFKLLYLLEKIGITLEEFLLACNSYAPPEFNSLIKAVQKCSYNQEIKELINLADQENKYFTETRSHYHKLNAIFIQSIISGIDKNYQLNPQDISYLSNYLFSIKNWGYYETLILGNCCRTLPPMLLFQYSKEALEKGHLYNPIPRNKQALIQLLLNSLLIMIENGLHTESVFLMQSTKKMLVNSTYFFEQTILLYLEGYLDLKFYNNVQKAISKIEEALKIFKNFNKIIYKNYKEHFDEHISNLL